MVDAGSGSGGGGSVMVGVGSGTGGKDGVLVGAGVGSGGEGRVMVWSRDGYGMGIVGTVLGGVKGSMALKGAWLNAWTGAWGAGAVPLAYGSSTRRISRTELSSSAILVKDRTLNEQQGRGKGRNEKRQCPVAEGVTTIQPLPPSCLSPQTHRG